MSSLKEQIKEFVSTHLPSEPKTVSADKIVNDAVWGTVQLRTYEVALLDTPLMQRLRRIHQTSFAYLTYPSAVHTRFEHSIGCLHLASKYYDELRRKDEGRRGRLIQEDVADNVRAAALLHDVGHGPFSHSSEEIYDQMPEMESLTAMGKEFEGVKAHEVLSCLIILSEPFKEFIEKLNKQYETKLNVDRMAHAIAGRSDPRNQFESDILNGPFDVDKVDYVVRDGRLIGLPIAVDLHRLFTSMNVSTSKVDGRRFLAVELKGEITLEQLIFGKMVLFTSVYHHHKARSCDCLLKGVFEYSRRKNLKFGGRSMNSPADFLWWTDDILSEEGSRRKDVHPDLHSLMHGLSYRRLLKRALAIAPDFIKDTKNSNFKDLEELNRNHREHRVELRKLAKKIWLDAGSPCPLELVWLDLPKPPGFKESHAIQVRKPNGDLCRLNEFFNTDQWAEHFNQHKWRGHVFAPDDCAQAISISARKILEQEFALEFDPIAWQICHLS